MLCVNEMQTAIGIVRRRPARGMYATTRHGFYQPFISTRRRIVAARSQPRDTAFPPCAVIEDVRVSPPAKESGCAAASRGHGAPPPRNSQQQREWSAPRSMPAKEAPARMPQPASAAAMPERCRRAEEAEKRYAGEAQRGETTDPRSASSELRDRRYCRAQHASPGEGFTQPTTRR